MDETIDQFELAGDKFMSKKHLRQPEFTYSACREKKLRKQKIHNIFIKTNHSIDKTYFQHDKAHKNFKDFS